MIDAERLTGQRFELALRRLADALVQGIDASPYVGSGIDFAMSRLFAHGDDVRSIDWKATARTRRWHVKERESTRRMPVLVVLDGSASMRASSQPLSKWMLAVQVAGGVGLAGIARGSPVGLAVIGAALSELRPSSDRQRLIAALHRLRADPGAPAGDLSARLDELARLERTRALVVVLSDLHQPGIAEALARVGLRHDLLVIQPVDPLEDGLVGAGFVHAREAETGARWNARGGVALAEDLTATLAASAIDHLRLRTDGPLLAPLRRFLADRGQRRSRA